MIQKKIAMLGSYAVGKTSLVRQFVSSLFDEKYHTTIGVKVDKVTMSVNGQDVLLMLWDIAGSEDHFNMPMSYIRGAAGCLLVIDGTRRETVEKGLELIEQVTSELGQLPMVVAANKADLKDEWQLDDQTIAPLEALGYPLLNSSAKTGMGVEDAFVQLARQVL